MIITLSFYFKFYTYLSSYNEYDKLYFILHIFIAIYKNKELRK